MTNLGSPNRVQPLFGPVELVIGCSKVLDREAFPVELAMDCVLDREVFLSVEDDLLLCPRLDSLFLRGFVHFLLDL